MRAKELLTLAVDVNRIGAPGSRMRITDARGATLFERHEALPDHRAAFRAAFAWLAQHDADQRLEAVGHRVVHGGFRYSEPQLITSELVAALQEMAPLSPDHLPQAICGIEIVSRTYPMLQQAACFDTAFHRRMPKRAQMYALPRHFHDDGIMRFGFHGLSYEYITQALRRLEPTLADGRVIVAHLGNGASMAAIRGGKSIDTSMGLTPTSGLIMGTRCGDIDPGVLIDLIEKRGMTPQAVNTLINQHSGLLGLSGTSADMRDLLTKESTDPRAAEAIDFFCYSAKKYLGAYVAALGGLDILVFTGGIGEHAAAIRERICSELEPLGIKLDAAWNRADAPMISGRDSRVNVRVIKTDESLMIARHTVELIA
jgi:acetate kinase